MKLSNIPIARIYVGICLAMVHTSCDHTPANKQAKEIAPSAATAASVKVAILPLPATVVDAYVADAKATLASLGHVTADFVDKEDLSRMIQENAQALVESYNKKYPNEHLTLDRLLVNVVETPDAGPDSISRKIATLEAAAVRQITTETEPNSIHKKLNNDLDAAYGKLAKNLLDNMQKATYNPHVTFTAVGHSVTVDNAQSVQWTSANATTTENGSTSMTLDSQKISGAVKLTEPLQLGQLNLQPMNPSLKLLVPVELNLGAIVTMASRTLCALASAGGEVPFTTPKLSLVQVVGIDTKINPASIKSSGLRWPFAGAVAWPLDQYIAQEFH